MCCYSKRSAAIVGCVTALLVGSCVARADQPKTPPREGFVILVGGIGGLDTLPKVAKVVLPATGIKHEPVPFIWTHGPGRYLKDLQDNTHVEKKADELAEYIYTLRKRSPEKPIYLVGKSGGAGVVLAAVERLPAQTVERVILIAPAVSPNYDLRPALRATRREIVTFHSKLDQLILNLGTRSFGTIDRKYSASAGLYGFNIPNLIGMEDRALYGRLVQVPWSGRMLWEGHFGLHNCSSAPAFLGIEVGRWLRD